MPGKRIHIFGNLSALSQENTLIPDPNLPEIIARRSTPGILIFTFHNELVYINAEAREMLSSEWPNGNSSSRRRSSTVYIPEVVTNLCNQLKQLAASSNSGTAPSSPDLSRTPSILALSTSGSNPCSFRAFFLSNSQNGTFEASYILILIERISPTKKFDLHKITKQYRLSLREIEVIELLIRGYKNKEIADKLCVCVYTVEGHLKKIMKKMQVGNRTSILAKLLEGL